MEGTIVDAVRIGLGFARTYELKGGGRKEEVRRERRRVRTDVAFFR